LIDPIISEDIKDISADLDVSFFKDEKILITGGAGFLGSYLCDLFVSLGSYVTCLDNFSTSTLGNIGHLTKMKNFRLLRGDVSKTDIKETFNYIFHFSSRASPENYQLHPVETLITNSIGSHEILKLAVKGDSRILFASSSEIYGDPQVIPTSEDYWGNVNPIGVRSCYDEGKRFGEALFMAYYRQYGLDVRIARIHNTYGPRIRSDGNYARALPRFIDQALKGEDITVYGDGSQTRSFCYVSDTIRGVIATIYNNKAKGEVFNIGNPREISILELAEKIRGAIHSTSKIVFQPLPEDDPKRRRPNIEKARKKLEWQPNISLDDGLKRTIRWFKSANQNL